MQTMAVAPARAGPGLGARLLDALLAEAGAARAARGVRWRCAPTTTAAQRLYERRGFVRDGRPPRLLRRRQWTPGADASGLTEPLRTLAA